MTSDCASTEDPTTASVHNLGLYSSLQSGRLQATVLREERPHPPPVIQSILILHINKKKDTIRTSEKTFRKNGINVGMASTSIGRKEVSFIYVDHTINSARGQERRGCIKGWWPRAEFMV